MIKDFDTLAVVGAYSGRLLKAGAFNAIHEVFDHLYPGIMTLGLARMQPTASAYLARTIPRLAELPPFVEGKHEEYAAAALALLGPTVAVDGPHGTGGPEMMEPAP